jgi:hypothetical protein
MRVARRRIDVSDRVAPPPPRRGGVLAETLMPLRAGEGTSEATPVAHRTLPDAILGRIGPQSDSFRTTIAAICAPIRGTAGPDIPAIAQAQAPPPPPGPSGPQRSSRLFVAGTDSHGRMDLADTALPA